MIDVLCKLELLCIFDLMFMKTALGLDASSHILVEVKIYRRLRIGQDGHLDQSAA